MTAIKTPPVDFNLILARKKLRIKIKSLAAEDRIIRNEERRSLGQIRNDLWLHRVRNARKAARQAQLAYAFLRWKSYSLVEPRSSDTNSVDWESLWKEIQRFYPSASKKDFQIWKLDALSHRRDVKEKLLTQTSILEEEKRVQDLVVLRASTTCQKLEAQILALQEKLRRAQERSQEASSLQSALQDNLDSLQEELEVLS